MQGIYRTESLISAVFAAQQQNYVEFPLVRKEFMVDGFRANVGIGIVLPTRSSFSRQDSLYFFALV